MLINLLKQKSMWCVHYKLGKIFVNSKNQVELVHFSKILLMIKNACDHCSWSSMITILLQAKTINWAYCEHDAFKMRADRKHDKPCANNLDVSTSTHVSEQYCITLN